MHTLSDLVAYCRLQARIESHNYIDPWARGELRVQQISAWRRDCRRRDAARKECLRAFPGRLASGTEPLTPGSYGRLTILPNGEPDYCVGQYAPTEVYGALLQYLQATN